MTDRRTLLTLAAGGLSMLAGCQSFEGPRPSPSIPRDDDTPTPEGTPTSEPEEEVIVPPGSFGQEIDMVEDVGVDDTGSEPIDDAFDSTLTNDALLVFPEGRYKLDSAHTIANFDRIGIVGRGNAVIVPNTVWNGKLFEVMHVGEFLMAGVDLDITHQNTTVGLRVACEERFRIEDLEFVGRGTHPDEDVIHALNAGLVNEDGRGVVRRMVAKKGSAIDRYKNGGGRGGIYVGPWNRGTISIEDCHLAEFGNNAIYASRTPGNVRVSGGTFRNNSPSSVRISGRGSWVEDAHIELDLSKYTGPPIDGDNFKARGVVIEQKTTHPDTMTPAGAVMRGCDVNFKANPTQGPPVVVWSNGKTLSIENCRIHVENNTPAVVRDGMQKQGTNPPWDGDRWIRITNTRITGGGQPGEPAVRLTDAPGSELHQCQIQRTEPDCTGVDLVRSAASTIRGGSIRTGSFPVLIEVDGQIDGCLVSFVNRPELVMVASDGGDQSVREEAVCRSTPGDDAGPPSDTASSCCVTQEDLSRLFSEGTSSVGVTSVDGGDVAFQSFGGDG